MSIMVYQWLIDIEGNENKGDFDDDDAKCKQWAVQCTQDHSLTPLVTQWLQLQWEDMNIEQGLIDMFAVESSSLHDGTHDSVTFTAPLYCIAHKWPALNLNHMIWILNCTALLWRRNCSQIRRGYEQALTDIFALETKSCNITKPLFLVATHKSASLKR